MDRQDLIERLTAGEDSGHQFKANFNSIDQLAVEIAAFAAKYPDFGYTGRGSGILRILRLCRANNVPVTFIDDGERHMFRVIFGRPDPTDPSPA